MRSILFSALIGVTFFLNSVASAEVETPSVQVMVAPVFAVPIAPAAVVVFPSYPVGVWSRPGWYPGWWPGKVLFINRHAPLVYYPLGHYQFVPAK